MIPSVIRFGSVIYMYTVARISVFVLCKQDIHVRFCLRGLLLEKRLHCNSQGVLIQVSRLDKLSYSTA